jgi:hypothetical protein
MQESEEVGGERRGRVQSSLALEREVGWPWGA